MPKIRFVSNLDDPRALLLAGPTLSNDLFFRYPVVILKHLEKLQRNFLRQGIDLKTKSLIWSSGFGCASLKEEGGLGIRSLKEMNADLLSKWLWRLWGRSAGLRKQILVSEYDISRDGWLC